MKKQRKIAVLGGDLRQYAAAKELSRGTAEVLYAAGICDKGGAERLVNVCEPYEALAEADVVLLPLPASLDGKLLNCPATKSSERLPLAKIIDGMTVKSMLFGGRLPADTVAYAKSKGITVCDYFLSERLQIKNAYVTAEAALSIAMNSLDKCIRDSRFAITGSGRIARCLAELLCRMGAYVTVAARNADSLAYFELMGAHTLQITEREAPLKWYDGLKNGYDVIFNTVPATLLDREFLEKVNEELMLIELASSPGGIDVCAARELGSNVSWASSLPGKYAPESAGRLIAEYVTEYLEGMEAVSI